ncbi:MAG: SpoVG family protein [Christensenellales bacterium]
MNITEVRIKIINKEDSRIKGLASITIDGCFVVHDIKILEKENSYLVSMPSKKNLSGKFSDICHPINSETRELLDKTVIEAFEKAKVEQTSAE